MQQQSKVSRLLRKTGRIVLKTFLWVLGILILVLVLIQTPPVQNFLRGKAQTWLHNKLKTRVEIGKIYIGFPKKIVLEGIYLEDLQKDTLFYGGRMKFDVDMWKLIRGNEIFVKEINLEDINASVKRVLPDTVYNFQFIIDAFASKEPDTATNKDTSSMKISLDRIVLNKIRARYNDAVTGNDMTVYIGHFDTNIETFDLQHASYAVGATNLSGLRANVYQRKPLVEAGPEAKDKAGAQEAPAMQLQFDKIALEDCIVDYGNDVSAFYANLNLGELNVNPQQFDLNKRIVRLDELELNKTTAIIRLGKKPEAKIVVKEAKQEVAAQAEAGWLVQVKDIQLNGNNFKMDNDNAPHAKQGMDYSHLDLKDLTLEAENIHYGTDTISGSITEGHFTEKSGFRLIKLETEFAYAAKGAYLHNLVVETPGTTLTRSIDISYPSLEAVKKNINTLRLNMDVRDSKVQVKDILTFVPTLKSQPALSNPNATFFIHSQVSGSLNNLRIASLRLKGLQQTNVEMSGTLKGLPDMKKVQANLVIKDISSSARDVMALLPKGTLPASVTIPSQFNVSGSVKGNEKNLVADLLLNTTLGTLTFKGTVKDPADSNNIQYDALVTTRSLDLKQFLKQPDLGLLTMQVKAKGKGYNPKTMNAVVDGTIAQAQYKGYTYRDFKLNGSIAQQQFTLNAGIQNAPVHFSLESSGSLAGKYPAIKLHAVIDSIKVHELNLVTDKLIYRGNIDADFPILNIDSLEGKLLISKNLLIMGDNRIETDSVSLAAAHTDSGQTIRLRSEAFNALLYGQYKLTQLGTVLQRSVEKYFSNATDSMAALPPYDFTIRARVVNRPILKAFLPDLIRMDPIILNGHFTSNGGLNASLQAPLIEYGTNTINNLQLTANTNEERLQALATIETIASGKSLAIYSTSLRTTIQDNKIDFALGTKDKLGKNKYHLEGLMAQPGKGVIDFSLKPDSLLLNYQNWVVNQGNKITIDSANITAKDFTLSQGNQQLSIATRTGETGQPLGVDFKAFRIATLVSFVQSDSLLADGELNGNISLRNLTKQPTFIGDLTVKNVSVNKDTVGDLHIAVNNETQNNYNADVTLTGRGNDVNIKGVYKVADVSSFDANVAVKQLQLSTIEGASMGSIKKAEGTLSGNFAINGTPDKPNIDGQLTFNKVVFVPSMLSSTLKIDQQKIAINNDGITFNKFTIKDSANNEATLDGTALTSNFTNYKFDLVFNARNFQALSSTKKDNRLYYGTLFFNSRLNIKGTELHPVVDGSLAVNEKTKLTVVLPQDDPSVQDREGIVRFVDKDGVPNDTLFLNALDSLNTATFRDFDVSVNITIDKEAELNLVVDEGNGDFLRVKGEAALNGGIDPSGKVTLTGTYELQQGSYELSFNFLKRKFNIQKGSRITWQGEPTKADVDLTAMYIANTAPIDLVESQLPDMTAAVRNTYRQRLPFEVYLHMTGELLKPSITFDVKLPEEKNYSVSKDIVANANTKLEQLRQQPGEMNKQVFSLLLLNRFMRENPFETGNSGLTAESLARQSVSKLLTEQLNNLASDLVQGVDINFDVQSAEDYSTGSQQNRTDLNVALSKRLLNDRLTVTVGSNFELEGPSGTNRQSNNIAGNVAIDYQLSKDGRYMIRGYRKNEYEGILEGYIVETGVGFVITIDYNKFKEIFESAKKKEQRREERRKLREQQEGTKEQPPTVPKTE